MQTYTINDICEMSRYSVLSSYVPADWRGSLIDILEVEDCPVLDRLWTVWDIVFYENDETRNALCRGIGKAVSAVYDETSGAEAHGNAQVGRIIQKLLKMENHKIYTIEDIREASPCYDPAKYLRFDWAGTFIDILRVYNCPALDRLWVVAALEQGENLVERSDLFLETYKAWRSLRDTIYSSDDVVECQVSRIISLLEEEEEDNADIHN